MQLKTLSMRIRLHIYLCNCMIAFPYIKNISISKYVSTMYYAAKI